MHVRIGHGGWADGGGRAVRAAAAYAATTGAAAVRAGRAAAAQLELAVRLFDGAEDVGDGEGRRMRVLLFGTQGHGQVGTIELRQYVRRRVGWRLQLLFFGLVLVLRLEVVLEAERRADRLVRGRRHRVPG